jgi:Sulfotransferase domain
MIVFLSGVHRSGTNMMMRILERCIDTDVFHESDARAFSNYMMRGDEILRELIERSPSRRIVFKALHEAHELRTLMTKFQPSRSIWMYRHFDDVVNSILERWPRSRNMMDQIITKADAGGWRELGMTDRTREFLASLYHKSMNDATITALFWYQRNQLLFDQKLECDRNCMLVNYGELAQTPVENLRAICAFLDITHTSYMHRMVHAHSIAKRPSPPIEPRVRAFCQDMYQRLLEASRTRRPRRDDSAFARVSA